MNEENLKRGNPDTQFRSGREAVENGRKGGVASGISRSFKSALKKKIKSSPELTDDLIAVLVDEAYGRNLKAIEMLFELNDESGSNLDRKLKQAQIDKIKAETEAIKRQNDDNDTVDEDFHRSLVDALDQSTANVWKVETQNEN